MFEYIINFRIFSFNNKKKLSDEYLVVISVHQSVDLNTLIEYLKNII